MLFEGGQPSGELVMFRSWRIITSVRKQPSFCSGAQHERVGVCKFRKWLKQS